MATSVTSCTSVTPLAGVWIEIYHGWRQSLCSSVTPLAGVWIEILNDFYCVPGHVNVTPLAGVWIEMTL